MTNRGYVALGVPDRVEVGFRETDRGQMELRLQTQRVGASSGSRWGTERHPIWRRLMALRRLRRDQ
ncbi:hypothetical protein EXIGLDRAFT_735982 [Exidia glandulosa HHB12029]|uniref:Uncharacterized protein n=1 Tax=Exidia glandulosa HHB12029 TaxID=1314781 RepID=A0A165JMW6_EXIGL|nr:hypothetical protein EXIGLDRAFT_735982 [Exidia glandulosa HHB12029]